MKRIFHGLFLGGILLCAAPVWGTTYVVERKVEPGARRQVQEERVVQLGTVYKGQSSRVGNNEVSELEQAYVEEVRSAQPEERLRRYLDSRRSKVKGKGKVKPEFMVTSLHERQVLMTGLHLRPVEGKHFEISKQDRETLRLDLLAQALVPGPQEVELKDSWTVPGADLIEVLLGGSVRANTGKGAAKVELRSVKKSPQGQWATLRVRLQLQQPRQGRALGLELTLRGELKWDLDDGVLVEARLEGPLAYFVSWGEGQEAGELEARGTCRWSYKAEILQPVATDAPQADLSRDAPPPPEVKSLRCPKDPRHVYSLEYTLFCSRCGARLDKERRCPKECPWSFWHCPVDGTPLEPH